MPSDYFATLARRNDQASRRLPPRSLELIRFVQDERRSAAC
jgi:hypothetical protein